MHTGQVEAGQGQAFGRRSGGDQQVVKPNAISADVHLALVEIDGVHHRLQADVDVVLAVEISRVDQNVIERLFTGQELLGQGGTLVGQGVVGRENAELAADLFILGNEGARGVARAHAAADDHVTKVCGGHGLSLANRRLAHLCPL